MNERRTLWIVVAFLVLSNGVLLYQNHFIKGHFDNLRQRFIELRDDSALPTIEASYLEEQEAMVNEVRILPEAFPRVEATANGGQGYEFYLIGSVEDCSNCIEDEISKLNDLVYAQPKLLAGVHGYLLDKPDPDDPELPAASDLLRNLSPVPRFAFDIEDPLRQLDGATTPLVLVVRAEDGRILDAHKPIPEDLTKRDAFYTLWGSILGGRVMPGDSPASDRIAELVGDPDSDAEDCDRCSIN